MTDKQIIIDGVDVSGCAGYYFSPTKFHSCQDIQQVNNLGYEQDTLCEQNPNCYYKQLKRKEQECERLKLIVAHSCHDVLYEDSLRGQLDQLKAENEKLDTENKRLVAELANPVFDSFEELDKLKQTLTEIKKLCSTGIVHGLSADEYATNLNILKFDILQKISECEVEDET